MVYIYITPYFPQAGSHFGSYGYDFVAALRRNTRYDVRVFVPGNGPDYEYRGFHVYRFPVINLPSGILPMTFAALNARSFLKKLVAIGLDVNEVSVCHANTARFAFYANALKKKNVRVRTVLHHHDLASIGLRLGALRHWWPHKLLCYLWLRRMAEQIDLHVFISTACKRSFCAFPDTRWSCYEDYQRLSRGLRRFRPVRIKDSYILPNGVDGQLFNVEGSPHKNISREGFTIGCIGNFIEVKDHLTLVRAFKRVRDIIPGVKLEFLGDNGYRRYLDEVQAYIREFNLSAEVSYISHVPHEKLPAIYRRWDLFVLPSYFEGFGCVYTESWACGTPFIACKGQGIEDVLPKTDRDKWLAAPRDDQDLAKKIIRAYRSRDKQVLSGEIYIDPLVRRFIHYLEV